MPLNTLSQVMMGNPTHLTSTHYRQFPDHIQVVREQRKRIFSSQVYFCLRTNPLHLPSNWETTHVRFALVLRSRNLYLQKNYSLNCTAFTATDSLLLLFSFCSAPLSTTLLNALKCCLTANLTNTAQIWPIAAQKGRQTVMPTRIFNCVLISDHVLTC